MVETTSSGPSTSYDIIMNIINGDKALAKVEQLVAATKKISKESSEWSTSSAKVTAELAKQAGVSDKLASSLARLEAALNKKTATEDKSLQISYKAKEVQDRYGQSLGYNVDAVVKYNKEGENQVIVTGRVAESQRRANTVTENSREVYNKWGEVIGTRTTQVVRSWDEAQKKWVSTTKIIEDTSKKAGTWSFGNMGLDKLNDSLNRVRWTIVNFTFLMAGAAVVASPFVLWTKQGMEMEQQLKRIQAVSGKAFNTEESRKQLESFIKESRIGTPFSSIEVGGALEEFIKAGFDSKEAMISLKPVLDLATAGFMDLNNAGTIVAQTMHEFANEGMTAQQAADLIYQAAIKSALSVETFGNAMSYVGPIASQLGYSSKETAAALTVLANAGLSGSKAGTTLRQVLSSIASPSEEAEKWFNALGISFYNADGSSKDLEKSISTLYAALENLDPESRAKAIGDMFNVRSASGVSSLMNAFKQGLNLSEVARGFDEIGTTAEAATIQMESSVNKLKDSLQNLKDSFLPVADSFNNFFSGVLDKASQATKAMNKAGMGGAVAVGGGAAAAGGGYLLYKYLDRGSAANPMYVRDVDSVAKKAASLIGGAGTTGVVAGETGVQTFLAGRGGAALLTGIEAGLAAAAITVATMSVVAAAVSIDSKITPEDKTKRETNEAVARYLEKNPQLGSATLPMQQGVASYSLSDSGTITKANETYTVINGDFILEKEPQINKKSWWDTMKEMLGIESKPTSSESTPVMTDLMNGGIMPLLDTQGNPLPMSQQSSLYKNQEKAKEPIEPTNTIDYLEIYNKELVTLSDRIKDLTGSKTPQTNKIQEMLFGNETYEGVVNQIKIVSDSFFNQMGNKALTVSNKTYGSSGEALEALKAQYNTYLTKISDSEIKIDKLEKRQSKLNLQINEQESLLQSAAEAVQEYNDKLSDIASNIDKLTNMNFDMETPFSRVIQAQEQVIRKQKLEALGITDVQSFIASAINKTGNAYDGVVDSINKVTDATSSSQDGFKAWQTTVKEHIKALIEEGNNLATNTTNAVQQHATLLMSVSKFNETDSKGKTASELQLERLQLAQAYYFGNMHEQVGLAIQDEDDRVNGVANNADTIITKLGEEWDARSKTNRLLEDAEEKYDTLNTTLKLLQEQYDKNALSILSEKEQIQDEISTIEDLSIAWQKALAAKNEYSGVRSLNTGSGTASATEKSTVDTYLNSDLGSAESEQAVSDFVSQNEGLSTKDILKKYGLYGGEMATGGIVTKETLATIGEAGPEAIIPLSKLDYGSSEQSISIGNITINGVSGDPKNFADTFVKEIKRQLKTS